MRKRKGIQIVVAVFFVAGLLLTGMDGRMSKKAFAAQEDVVTSADATCTYRVLNDGTISLVTCSGGLSEMENGGYQVTFPDEVDGKIVSGIEYNAINDYASESVAKVILPKQLKTIDITGFRNLFYFSEIEIDASNTYFSTEEGVLFDKEKETLLRVPSAKEQSDGSKDYVIPDTVTEIADDAFYDCYGVQNITISKNVSKIGNCAFFRYLPLDYTFTFTVDSENENFVLDEQGNLFSKDMTTLYRYVYPENTDESSFFNVFTYQIPDTVKVIASAAFQGSKGSGMIDGLVNVTIPDMVTEIGESAFEGCSYLGDEWSASLGDDVTADIVIPDSVEKIGKSAFKGTAISQITLPKNLRTVETECFANCTSLESIALDNKLTEIGYGAFNGCSGLTDVKFGTSVTTIGALAFHNCNALSQITIPDSITTIGDYAFGFYGTGSSVEKIDPFVIKCGFDSAAYNYAKANDLTYAASGSTPTQAPTATPTMVPTQAPTATPTMVPTQAPTATPVPTATNTPSAVSEVKKPAVVQGISLKNKKSKKMIVSWKKAKNATGYQISYSTSKKMKAAKKVVVSKASKTKVTIKKLKKKKYYVRIRSYRKNGNGYLYSSWSKKKSIKIKK